MSQEMPRNGVNIVQGEVSLVVSAMRRNVRWASHNHQDEERDPLLHNFAQLKEVLGSISDLQEVDVIAILGPFLDVIRSEDTTGPITGYALSAVNKFLCYGLIDPLCSSTPSGVESLADAVTHARFVGTDPSSDEVVLMKILQVLRTLLLTPVGAHLTNESVCEIMQSCFRICFELRLSELLRRTAEQTLMDMVQLLSSRLPQLKEEEKSGNILPNIRRVFKRSGGISKRNKKSPKPKRASFATTAPTDVPSVASNAAPAAAETELSKAETPPSDNEKTHQPEEEVKQEEDHQESDQQQERVPSDGLSLDLHSSDVQDPTRSSEESSSVVPQVVEEPTSPTCDSVASHLMTDPLEGEPGTEDDVDKESRTSVRMEEDAPSELEHGISTETIDNDEALEASQSDVASSESSVTQEEYVSSKGVRFTPPEPHKEGHGPLVPYGLPCVRELLRFLISLINPHDRHNSEPMIHIGLSLLTVALESGATHIGAFPSLMTLINDELCKNLFMHDPLPWLASLLVATVLHHWDQMFESYTVGYFIASAWKDIVNTLAKVVGFLRVFQFPPPMGKVDRLLQCDVHSLFAMALWVCFLLFEALRGHLKLQLECYFKRLLENLALDHQVIPFEKRELILDNINQLFHVPDLVSEFYVNYDCDLYCINLFEELCKALSKNAFPAGSLTTANVPALDALLQVVHVIEGHCHPTIPLCTSPKPIKIKSTQKVGDDDSGTDENGDTPPFSPTPPPSSGFLVAKKMTIGGNNLVPPSDTNDMELDDSSGFDQDDGLNHSSALAVMFASSVPTPDNLAQLKQKKKLLQAGSEQFNTKAKKGLEFLQEHGFLSKPLDPEEVANHLRENIRLDKKAIGDYIGDRKNTKVLEAFARSFHFSDMRIDEALRTFLESFRLPGEAPVIQLILEHFSEAYFASHSEIFANADAAFTLAYGIIMLNVDQHNANMKQQKPMTPEEFKKNLRRCNGQGDYPTEMLDEVYQAIRGEEIVMPSERMGRIKDNYDWKVLLRRSIKPEGKYLLVSGSSFDQDLFVMLWGPTVAALSSVYDNCLEKTVVQKAISGFRKCALISAHYGLSDVFDNLVISLCKFTTLLNAPEAGENLPLSFGMNLKAQLAARTMFSLAYDHGDILREGWKNILDCMLQLYRAKMLPTCMVEVEDFVDQSGKICLVREEIPVVRPDSSIFSSFYQYFQMNSEPSNAKNQGSEDKEAEEKADNCIKECCPERLITESKFLRSDSLHELVKALIFASQGPEKQDSMSGAYDEDSAVFFLEQLISLTLQNRDRVSLLWVNVRDHLSSSIINSTKCTFLLERTVVGLLRLAVRLLRKEEISGQVLGALRVLLMMPLTILQSCGRHISYGLHELLRTNAASIQTAGDWTTIFTLLECVGAGVCAPTVTPGPASSFVSLRKDSVEEDPVEYGITGSVTSLDSDTSSCSADGPGNGGVNGDSWLLIGKDGAEIPSKNQYNLTISEALGKHDSKSFIKSCQSLAFILRDAKHVSSRNFLRCVHAVRVFGEALVDGGLGKRLLEHPSKATEYEHRRGATRKTKTTGKTKKPSPGLKTRKGGKTLNTGVSEDEMEINETINNTYDAMSLQLIELIYTLHTNASTFFPEKSGDDDDDDDGGGDERSSAKELEACLLWAKCWCPLLQGIAQLCCDIRKEVRMSALTYLQRALLVRDLHSLGALEWEACFNKVLFPMLSKLLAVSNQNDTVGLEETRMRAATLLSKVFLQHLNLLLSLPTFTALWLTILDFMDKYMHSDESDLLSEAIPESLKNMLLVMSTAGIFHDDDVELNDAEARHYTALWQVTWERIDCFLPNLKQDLFASRPRPSPPVEIESPAQETKQSPETENEITNLNAEEGNVECEAAHTSPRASSPLLEAQETVGSPQVCVMLQPPLPSLAGSRSSSPTQKGSLSDVAQTPPASMPIILAPSPLSRIPIFQEIDSEVPKDETRVLINEPLANNSEELASEGADSPSVIRDV